MRQLWIAAALTACAGTPRISANSNSASRPVVAIISANVEWKIVTAQLHDPVHDSPYGQWLSHRLGSEDVIFFHGGYGKVAAAGSAQYAIDHWRPRLLVNLGTCGGFGGERKVGDIVLASSTTIYDIVELMGDPEEPIADFRTQLDTSIWPATLAARVVIGPIVSADRDLDPAAVAQLHARFHASVGDWESGAIAYVGSHNRVPTLILRGVSDLVDAPGGDPTYNAVDAWQRASVSIMASLIALLGDALPSLPR